MTEISKGDTGDHQQCSFKRVLIHKSETLGTGAYGVVCKAKCDQLICAAKLLHPVLFPDSQSYDTGKEHRQPFRRFELECQFLSRINHPNIILYLGTYRDPETNAPVLLMELMDESLTYFLESSPGDIPYHIQVNLSQDIAQALAFLHANGIIHRDLSSNNVLLIAGSRAKVSDFGMSKLTHLSAAHLATMTQCPGTPVFMSPEALDDPPEYTEKLDTFSFGVLLIQILTRKFPKPSSQFEKVLIPSPHDPKRMVKSRIPIPEVKRRQDQINLIDPTHLLLPIALECLRDEATERPSSEKLCQFLYNLTKTIKYSQSSSHDLNSVVKAQEKQIKDLSAVIEAREKQIEEILKTKDELFEAKSEEKKIEQNEASLDLRVKTHEDKVMSEIFQTPVEDDEFQLWRMRPRLSAGYRGKHLRQQRKDSLDLNRYSKMLSDQGCPKSKDQAKDLQHHSIS